MKICLINNLYGENARGGAERAVEIIARGLKEKGHEVFVISSKSWMIKSDDRRFLSSDISDNSEKRYWFFPFNLCWYGNLAHHGIIFRLFWHAIDIFNLHSFFVIREILEQERPDIVWTHNLMGLGFLIPLAVKFLKIKHIHTLHDVQLSVPSGLIVKGEEKMVFGQKFYEKICSCLFGSPDIVISPSKWLLDFYIEKGFFPKSKKIVLQNPINPQSEIVNLKSEILNILYLGQIEDHKGIVFAVNALKKMPENFVLHIVGDGGKLEEIKNITENDNHFIIYGRKTGAELEEIWKKVNLMIVPSLCYENSPTVIFESLSRRIPVIASNIGGIPEILPPEFLFEAGNEADFTQKIKWFLENKEKSPGINFSTMSANDYIEQILK